MSADSDFEKTEASLEDSSQSIMRESPGEQREIQSQVIVSGVMPTEVIQEQIKLTEKVDSISNEIVIDNSNNSQPSLIDDRFEILELLGAGASGTVYKVFDRLYGQERSLKLLHKKLLSDNTSVRRFAQEADAASNLSHPNLVAVYEHGQTEDGSPFICMNYVEGRNLAELLKSSGRLDNARALDLFIQIAEGLEHAHQENLIHRDLKPSNILISDFENGYEQACIVDFGIAKAIESGGDTLSTLTSHGDFIGTPAYMSPEQCMGGTVTPASDIYSLGCMLFEAVNGEPPFAKANTVEIIARKIGEESPVVKNQAVPGGLRLVIQCAMSRSIEERYASVSEIIADLKSVKEGKAPKYARNRLGVSKSSILKRSLATIVDYAIYSSFYGFIFIFSALLSVFINIDTYGFMVGLFFLFGYFVAPPLIYLAYIIGFEVKLGSTPGKMLFGLRVCDENGDKLSWKRSLARILIKSFVLTLVPFLGIGIAICLYCQIVHKQMPWDVMSGTRVRKRRELLR